MNHKDLPTVRVVCKDHPAGFIIINECDLTDEHELLKEKTRIVTHNTEVVGVVKDGAGNVLADVTSITFTPAPEEAAKTSAPAVGTEQPAAPVAAPKAAKKTTAKGKAK